MDVSLPIKFSDKALVELRKLKNSKGVPKDYALRLGVRGAGGCGGGMGYALGFDAPSAKDKQYDYEGLTVLIDPAHLMHLLGLIVDYEERMDEQGFTFENEKE